MPPHADIPRIAIQVSQGVVVASIQVDLDEDILDRFREDLLGCVHETGSSRVILDVSGLETLDSAEFAALRRIIVMTRIMGAETVLVGLRPGVVSALIETGANVDGLLAARDLDAGFAMLRPDAESEAEGEGEAESAGDDDTQDGLPRESLQAPEAEG